MVGDAGDALDHQSEAIEVPTIAVETMLPRPEAQGLIDLRQLRGRQLGPASRIAAWPASPTGTSLTVPGAVPVVHALATHFELPRDLGLAFTAGKQLLSPLPEALPATIFMGR